MVKIRLCFQKQKSQIVFPSDYVTFIALKTTHVELFPWSALIFIVVSEKNVAFPKSVIVNLWTDECSWRRDCQCRKVLPNCGWVYSLRKPSVSWRLDPWARRCDTSHRQKNDGIFWRKKSSISAVASQFPRRKSHRKRLGNIEKCSWAKKSKNQARTDWSNTEFQKCHHEGNQRKFDEFCWKASKVL